MTKNGWSSVLNTRCGLFLLSDINSFAPRVQTLPSFGDFNTKDNSLYITIAFSTFFIQHCGVVSDRHKPFITRFTEANDNYINALLLFLLLFYFMLCCTFSPSIHIFS